MQISFFEEFPNSNTLSKLDLIKFPTKLYLAEYSIEGYKNYKEQLHNKYKNLKEVVWWPVLNVDEGYWLSPWSKRRALLRLFHSLLDEKIPILWDAEYPKKIGLFLTQFLKHFKNKRLIRAFFKKYQGKIYTAEYIIDSKFLESSCLSFDPNRYNNIKIKMLYSSMHPRFTDSFVRNEIKKLKEKYSENIFIGLGVLDMGMTKLEPKIKPEHLERDLQICKELGIKEVVIYRLGGLNEEYLKVIKKFT